MISSLPILYQDDALLVCIKPAGVDSQAGMCALLSEQAGRQAYCVHRLDRDVGGVMVYALSSEAAAALSRSITVGALEKTYLAVCEGRAQEAEGELRDLLYHDTAKNKTYVVKRLRRGVREAALRYRLLDASEGFSLLQIELLTGRSHQIRVQFASRGLPLCGDRKYGAKTHASLALWSASLAFPHPLTGEALRFSAPPPDAEPWNLFKERSDADAHL